MICRLSESEVEYMENIFTYDKDGNKVIVRYSQETVAQKEPQTDIVIDTYPEFKMCIRKSQEEQEIAYGKGDKRYELALRDLLLKEPEKYKNFARKLRAEYNSR